MNRISFLETAKLILCIGISMSAGIIGSFAASNSVAGWYQTLHKPSFNPPDWLFGPVWTTLFVLMGIAAYLVWRHGLENKLVRISLIVFIVQLFLNLLWSLVFFGLKSPGGALIDIAFLWAAILITLIYFFKVSIAAGWLMMPYIAWVSFAVILNFAIWRMN
jgi:tryptophan-rich sensory protein